MKKLTLTEVNDLVLASGFNCVRDLARRAIIYCKDGTSRNVFDGYHFLLPDGSYTQRGFSEQDLIRAAHEHLSVFPFIELQKQTVKGGLRNKFKGELLEDYGVFVSRPEVQLYAQKTGFPCRDGIFTVATCPFRVQPEYSALAEEYINMLCGNKKSKLKKWLAGVSKLDRGTSGLVLVGDKETTHSFVDMLSLLWGSNGPTNWDTLTSRFNYAAAKQPLIHLAKQNSNRLDYYKDIIRLRQIIGNYYGHRFEKQHKNAFSAEGHLRVVITLEQMEPLRPRQYGSKEELEALEERLFVLRVPPINQQNLPKNDEFAKHVLWLSENHRHPARTRFLVAGSIGALSSVQRLQAC